MAARDRCAAGPSAGSARPNWRANILGVQSSLEAHHAPEFQIPTKEAPNEFGLFFDDMESAVFDTVGDRDRSAHPNALPLRGGDLVADSLAGDLPLELRER